MKRHPLKRFVIDGEYNHHLKRLKTLAEKNGLAYGILIGGAIVNLIYLTLLSLI